MKIDQKSLRILLAMNDEQLSALLAKIAKESGITPEALGMRPDDLNGIRKALGAATEEEIARLNELYAAYRQNPRK